MHIEASVCLKKAKVTSCVKHAPWSDWLSNLKPHCTIASKELPRMIKTHNVREFEGSYLVAALDVICTCHMTFIQSNVVTLTAFVSAARHCPNGSAH